MTKTLNMGNITDDANHEYRADRRHKNMVDVSELETLRRIAQTALTLAKGA